MRKSRTLSAADIKKTEWSMFLAQQEIESSILRSMMRSLVKEEEE